MQLFSTGNSNEITDFRTAVKQGLAPDGGLYFPKHLPRMPDDFWKEQIGLSMADKARLLFDILLEEDFTPQQRAEIVDRSFTFDAPVVALDEQIHVLELFHGPTLAFKDFGARTMAAMLSLLAEEKGEQITIVTATSGDTGAAVAHGFHKTPGVEVFVFYPAGQVSLIQEKQFATLGDNITALEVDGNFDDCQRLVKACFADKVIRSEKQLTTANSINIARLLPQMVYYIHAAVELLASNGNPTGLTGRSFGEAPLSGELVCSVPSGNFGNLTAGLMAHKMGIPVSRFIAATNMNHVVPDYLQEGVYRPRASLRTISNAMDVGDPSNFNRMLQLYDNDRQQMAGVVNGAWFDDERTSQAIVEVWKKFGYLMDPHTAVSYLGCLEYLDRDNHGLILATAHPAKFPDTINKLLPGVLETPERLTRIAGRAKQSIPVSADMEEIRSILLQ
ncbi:MAG: threonine synthase [Balneolales bacterium]